MNNNMVQWAELQNEFYQRFPRIIYDVLTNETPAIVLYCGVQFEIRRHPAPHVLEIQVWGQPFINNFPN